MSITTNPSTTMEFGRFKVAPQRRELLADGHPVELGGRLFDLLLALINARGTVVGKNDLIRGVWAGRVVEENSLTVGIATLRKALGTDRDLIRTISGRGYQFVGDIRECAPVAASVALTNLPAPMSGLIGREAALSEVCRSILEHRLLTLTGGGGIGKTRLAVEAARTLLTSFPDGVWIADLAPLNDPELVPVSVAHALGLNASDITAQRLAIVLGAQQILVVLDNCEHVIDLAARTAGELLRGGPNVHVLCTSREPLRVDDEWVYNVQPLDVPTEDTLADEDLLATSAVKLFVTRACAAHPLFRLDPSMTARLVSVCRRLDGMPLAIELAAARAGALGVQEVEARLNERFRLLTGGRRTAPPRHQTLRATFDWSYELLRESERLSLCRLGVFAGEFTLEAADHILMDPGDDNSATHVLEDVASLVNKSLLSMSSTGAVARYRMLETTRAYALEKLVEREELQRYARRHAQYYLAAFRLAAAEWRIRSVAEWLSDYTPLMGDGRAALDWAFSADGDPTLGAELTIALSPLWIELALMEEWWISRVTHALHTVMTDRQPSRRLEMQLNAVLAAALQNLRGDEAQGEAAPTAPWSSPRNSMTAPISWPYCMASG
jgi:predicted ATPase/DNA-binding winged helix-turn-helix (wHTH) protein